MGTNASGQVICTLSVPSVAPALWSVPRGLSGLSLSWKLPPAGAWLGFPFTAEHPVDCP